LSATSRLESRSYSLDQNFPILAVSAAWPQGLTVDRLGTTNPDLVAEVEDWEILLELEHRGGCAGLLSCDARMLDSLREMLALQRTALKLVVADGVGHDPLKATGLLLVHLPDIHLDTAPAPLAYRLRPTSRSAERPGSIVNRIAERRRQAPQALIAAEHRAMRELVRERRPWLEYLLDPRS
jgi:hypothetical protein